MEGAPPGVWTVPHTGGLGVVPPAGVQEAELPLRGLGASPPEAEA